MIDPFRKLPAQRRTTATVALILLVLLLALAAFALRGPLGL